MILLTVENNSYNIERVTLQLRRVLSSSDLRGGKSWARPNYTITHRHKTGHLEGEILTDMIV